MIRTLTLLAALTLTVACRDHDTGATSTTTAITSVTTGTSDAGSTTGASTTADAGTAASSTTTGSSSSSTGSADASTTTGGVGGTSTTDPDAGTTFGTTAVESSGTTAVDPIQECLAMVDPGDECTECICTDCLAVWETCQQDEGCAAIQACAQIEGCYWLHCITSDCQTIINLWGGLYGASFELWKPNTKCLEANCRLLCPW